MLTKQLWTMRRKHLAVPDQHHHLIFKFTALNLSSPIKFVALLLLLNSEHLFIFYHENYVMSLSVHVENLSRLQLQ